MTLVKREVTGLGIGDKDGQAAEIEGVLEKITEDVGENDSTMYTLIMESGERQNVWGSTTMDQRIQKSDVGNFCRIQFDGIQKNPKTGRKFKDIQVYWEVEPVDERVQNWPGYRGTEPPVGDEPVGDWPGEFPEDDE